jgi:uncharacterized protein YciW
MAGKIYAASTNDNTPNTARNIGLLSGSKSFNGSVSSQDRVDFYKFRVSARSSFSLALTGLRANADVKLLNGAQRVVATSERPGTETERIRRNLSAGEYYVQVVRRGGSTRYRLRVDSELIPVEPPRDPGSTFATAFSVNLRTGPKAYRQFVGTTDPIDTYSFSLNSIQTVGATISGLSGRVRLSLYYDANNNGVADSSERITFSDGSFSLAPFSINQTLGAGTYFITVGALTSTSNTAYNINLGSTAVTGIRPTTDPGSDFTTAFDVGTLTSSRSYKQFVGVVDPVDTYRFSLDDVSAVGATVSGLTGRVRLSLYYDANNNGIADSSERITFSDGSFSLAPFSINQTLGAGTYFITVGALTSTSNTAYNINLGGTAVTGIRPTTDPGSNFTTAFDVGTLTSSRSYKQFVGVVDPVDTYRFSLDDVSAVGATVSGLTGRVRLSLYYDANNNGIADSSERITFSDGSFSLAPFSINQTLGAGTYFITVGALTSTSNTAYNLNLGGTAVTGIQPTTDPGSNFTTAFDAGSLTSSRSYRQFVGVVDPTDVYRFSLSDTRTVGATISGLIGRVRLSLYVDSNNNGIADASERITFSDGSFSLAPFTINRDLGAGTYFFVVDALTSTSNTAYNLNLGV